ncbi:synaptotagmin-15-like isoform X1 [Metopolophium dirhodum]|uniref:synaptotagmin-15-like isoform X1 n=1 Tax=Metopolophium dirhodum TaxID=44670 RepID=UPI002990050C|nr:synaptotagmin-15-like isoform X1 [Metopolophium dirhodum]XP_060876545.1 synaptotagmin-15-like isoform X1 [Metopolophium dirhodum]XP_060876546.1 synaptotagmin-15-like isoform X1 [Metopolophium dirhodum]
MFKSCYRCCLFYFGFGRRSEDVGLNLGLLENGNSVAGSTEHYTVQKISSFGRHISHDEDGLSVSGFTSDGEDDDPPPKTQTMKKRGKWGKPMNKPKDPKTPNSFQTLAGVSMMMLQPITAGAGSTSTPDLSLTSSKKEFSKKEDKMDYLSPASCKETTGWLKSQSMQDMTSTTDSDSFALSSKSADDNTSSSTARPHRFGSVATSMINVTSRLTSIRSKSSEVVSNTWKTPVDNAPPVDPNAHQEQAYGNVNFKITYDQHTKKLFVRVDNLDGLAPKGKDKRPYKTVLKLTLLPQEKSTKTSKTIAAAMSPVVNEDFFISTKCITNKVLRISVFDHEYQGKYDAVGHALFYLDNISPSNDGAQSVKLYKHSWPDINLCNINISLSYKKQQETLHIVVHEANNLNLPHEKSRTFVKIAYFSKGKRIKEYQSPSVPNTKNDPKATYEYKAAIRLDLNSTANGYVVIGLKEKGFLKRNESNLGRVIFGPFLYTERGYDLTPWGKVLLTKEGVSDTFKTYL